MEPRGSSEGTSDMTHQDVFAYRVRFLPPLAKFGREGLDVEPTGSFRFFFRGDLFACVDGIPFVILLLNSQPRDYYCGPRCPEVEPTGQAAILAASCGCRFCRAFSREEI